jgi:hypothetical protein
MNRESPANSEFEIRISKRRREQSRKKFERPKEMMNHAAPLRFRRGRLESSLLLP